jgi:paraquat-inducible protein A
MQEGSLYSSLITCTHCHLIQKIPQQKLEQNESLKCSRCESHLVVQTSIWKELSTTRAIALSALMIYPLGIFLPIMEIERFGHRQTASVWDGTVSLMTHGQIFIGLVVFTCSVIFPLLKLGGIFCLCMGIGKLNNHQKSKIFHFVETVGKWGMIDVLLVAILVAVVKLGDMVSISPGSGTSAFGICVVLSILASLSFNPSKIWST